MSRKSLADRFWARVEKGPGCWRWTGAQKRDGYGHMWAGNGYTGAHRVAYALVNGPVPRDAVVLHTCDNPICVRPDHLRLGTQGDNIRDMVGKGRHFSPQRGKTHCKRGHEFTPENTYIIPGSGKRNCRTCQKAYRRASPRAQREEAARG